MLCGEPPGFRALRDRRLDLLGDLVEDGVGVVSSLAGRVAPPRLPVGEVRIGGFGGVGGLRAWLRDEPPDRGREATQPFAEGMTADAAAEAGIPVVVVRRGATPNGVTVVGDPSTASDRVAHRQSISTSMRRCLIA